MNTITQKNTGNKRCCTIYESLEKSLKEVKLHKEGKIKLNTWKEFAEKNNKKE